MLRTFRTLAPWSTAAVLLIGLSSSALADIAEPEPEPTPAPAPEPPKVETKVETKTETKTETKDEKAEAKGCSVQDDTRDMFGLAGLVLLVSGAALLKRRA